MKFTKLSLIILLTATTAVQADLLSKILYWGLSIGVPVLKNVDDSRKGRFKSPIFEFNKNRIAMNHGEIGKKDFNLNNYDKNKLVIGTVTPAIVTAFTGLVFRRSIILDLANCGMSFLISKYKDNPSELYEDTAKLCKKTTAKLRDLSS